MIKKASTFWIIFVLLLISLPAYAQDMFQGMDSAEKKFNEAQSRKLVAFMSLETMFDDLQVRALAKAAGDGSIKKIERLVKDGVSVNARGTQDVTPLFWAMRDITGFKKLLELGADPNVVYADGNSVMHAAAALKDLRFLKTALEHGGNPNLVSSDADGGTPIFEAMIAGTDVVDILLSYGADINARDKSGSTPLLSAAMTMDYQMVFHLLERGADYKSKDNNGNDLGKWMRTKLGKISPGTKWAVWQTKVIDWLQAKGMEITASPKRPR